MGKMVISNGPGSLKSVIEPEAICATVARILLYLVLRKSRSVNIVVHILTAYFLDHPLPNMHCALVISRAMPLGGEGALAINRS